MDVQEQQDSTSVVKSGIMAGLRGELNIGLLGPNLDVICHSTSTSSRKFTIQD